MWVVSLRHQMLPSFLCREFVWHIPCCRHFYAGSFTHPKLPSFLCGSFSDTYHAGFFLCGEFLLHIPSWLLFYVGSFSYIFRAFLFCFLFVCLFVCLFLCEELLSSAVYSEDNPLRKQLGGSWPRRKVWKSHTRTREGSPRTTWTEQNKTKQETNQKWAQKWNGKKRNGSEL